MVKFADLSPEPQTEAEFATRRLLGRMTVSKSFSLGFGHADDVGADARTAWQVIAEDDGLGGLQRDDGEEYLVHMSTAGRVQVKARVVREQGRIAELRFERIQTFKEREPSLECLLRLDEAGAQRLMKMCLVLRGIDPAGGDTVKLDGDLLDVLTHDIEALSQVYTDDPDRFRSLIECDINAVDVVALAAKREALKTFEEMLAGGEAYDERSWQRFFEEQPWILGTGLSPQLLIGWSDERLEQVVSGWDVSKHGKRADGLLQTVGAIRSVVLAEIKRPTDELVKSSGTYRPGVWVPSAALTGGVAQAQATGQAAVDSLDRKLETFALDGYPTGDAAYLIRPRSFLIIGQLESLVGEHGVNEERFRSFELYRRNLVVPEVLTFDEVLARAKWAVDRAESASATDE